MSSPIILFVYNRPIHTQATLEALKKNTLAAQSDLFIFSDFAKNDSAKNNVEKVREIIHQINGFKSVQIVEREKNFGLANSVISGVTEIISRSGQVIVLEDDLETSPHFLKYMNDALKFYERDPKAFSIGGYQFPEKTMAIPSRYAFDTYASFRCCSWGWATWKDRWMGIDWGMTYFDEFMADPEKQNQFNRGGPDLTPMLCHQKEGRIDSWAIRFAYAHFDRDMHCIYPVKSLVNNIGLDNSGVHCGVDPKRQHKSLDKDYSPQKFCPAHVVDPKLASAFYKAFDAKEEGLKSFKTKMKKGLKKVVKKLGAVFFPKIRNVDVLVVNTQHKTGGAARAAWRAYCGIQKRNISAAYLTLIKVDQRGGLVGWYSVSLLGVLARHFSKLDRIPLLFYPNRLRTPFTPARFRNPLSPSLSKFKPKLLHLHWVAGSLLKIEDLNRFKGPIVWTLHDTWAFTGGCHYPGECEKYKNQCGTCPQLSSSKENDLSRKVWNRKKKIFSQLNLTLVSPSRWLAEMAKKSSLVSQNRIEVIPNGLDTQIFRPLDKAAAKVFLGMSPQEKVLLFGAEWLSDHRKGGDLLQLALNYLDFSCTLLTFGEGQVSLQSTSPVSVRSVGKLQDELSLAAIYSAADVFICPSREDNLPNTVAEALACGTPCAAFSVNGLPDMINHQVNGWLAQPFSAENLAEGIRWILHHPNPSLLREAARKKAETDYSLEVMAERYHRLYLELLK